MNTCSNYKQISPKIAECSVLKTVGIKYIAGEKRSGYPCFKCKEQWIDEKPPQTTEEATEPMKKIMEANGKMELPTLFEQAKSFIKAIANYIFAGFPNVPEGERRLRLNVCESNKCQQFESNTRTCLACACPVDSKVQYSGEDCPIPGNWARLPIEVINNAPPRRCPSCSGR
jgi:hypothetical protein